MKAFYYVVMCSGNVNVLRADTYEEAENFIKNSYNGSMALEIRKVWERVK